MVGDLAGRDVVENQFGHFEHANPVFAIEHFLELVVRLDERFVGGVLQIMAPDIIPEFLCDLGPRQRLVANNLSQLFVRFDRLHESATRLTFGFLRGRFFGHKFPFFTKDYEGSGGVAIG